MSNDLDCRYKATLKNLTEEWKALPQLLKDKVAEISMFVLDGMIACRTSQQFVTPEHHLRGANYSSNNSRTFERTLGSNALRNQNILRDVSYEFG